MTQVIVVTDVESGWDCVVGVYANEKSLLEHEFTYDKDDEEVYHDSLKALKSASHDCLIFHYREVQT